MAGARPTSRVDVIENFLGKFLGAWGSGMANEGHGPGSFMRGFGSAIGAPYQADLERFQMGQQNQELQAKIAQQQAQTAQTQRQTELAGQMATVNIPGMGPVSLPVSQLGNVFKGAAASGIGAQSRISVEQLKQQIAQNKVARVEDAKDPASGQWGRMAYNEQGQALGFLPGNPIDPKMLPTANTSQQWLETSPGTWQLVSKTSTSQKVPPQPASGLERLQQQVPALAASQTPIQKVAQKVPALDAAISGSGRKIYGDKPVVAFDPQSGDRIVTTPAEVAQKGYQQAIPIKEGDMEKWRTSQNQFNDVQMNTSRYTAAANAYASSNLNMAQRAEDQARLHDLLNKAGAFELQVKIAEGGDVKIPIVSALLEGLNREMKSTAYAGLSAQAKDLYDGYLRTMASVPAYQKALTGIGKLNKETIELELANIPNPTMAPADVQRKLGQWQENINQGVQGLPRMAGIPTIKDVRSKFEGESKKQELPADVQQMLSQKWTNR